MLRYVAYDTMRCRVMMDPMATIPCATGTSPQITSSGKSPGIRATTRSNGVPARMVRLPASRRMISRKRYVKVTRTTTPRISMSRRAPAELAEVGSRQLTSGVGLDDRELSIRLQRRLLDVLEVLDLLQAQQNP